MVQASVGYIPMQPSPDELLALGKVYGRVERLSNPEVQRLDPC